MELTGPASVSYDDVAATLSDLRKTPVTYAPTSPEDMYAMIASAGWGAWMAALTRDYGKAYASGWGDFTTDHVARITGSPPRSFREFATDVLMPHLG